jgi:hypothetical protein
VCLSSCRAFVLANDVVALALLDDLLDFGVLVAGADEEQARVRPDFFVLGQRDLDLLKTGLVPALAEDSQPLGFHPQRLADPLDPFVDLSEERLVPPDPPLSLFRHNLGCYSRGCLCSGWSGTADRMVHSRGLRLLQDARRLVAESWCHGADARDANGYEVEPWDDDAASWSLLGAMVAVMEREASRGGELPLAALGSALYALADLIETDSLADWNDDPRQTQENVLAVLDRAAAAYRDNCTVLQVSLN